MSFSQNLFTGDDSFTSQSIDPALLVNDGLAQSQNYATIDSFHAVAPQRVKASSRAANNDPLTSWQMNGVSGPGAVKYWQPPAVQPWDVGAGVSASRQNSDFNHVDGGTIPWNLVPRTEALPAVQQLQPSGMSRPPPYSSFIGSEDDSDTSVPTANISTVPAVRQHGHSLVQPQPRAVSQAPLATNDGLMTMSHGWMTYDSQNRARNSTLTQTPESRAPSSTYQSSAGMKIPGGSKEPSIARSLVSADSRVSSYLFFGTPATTPASLRASLPSQSNPLYHRAVRGTTTSMIGTSALPIGPTAGRNTTRGGSGSRARKFENYPADSQPLPAGLSRREICRNYPNHLHGDTLLRVVHGQGGEQGNWKARTIWEECPADGRGNATRYGRPHNYLEAAIRRAEEDASHGGRAVSQLGKPKRRRRETESLSDSEEGQFGPSSKRARPATGSDGSVEHIAQPAPPRLLPYAGASPRALQAFQSRSGGAVNARADQAALQMRAWDNSVQISDNIASNNTPNQLNQRSQEPAQGVTVSAPERSRAIELPVPKTDATIINEDQQPLVEAAAAAFKEALRQECVYQHQLIQYLNPDINKLSPEEQHGHIRRIWKAQYDRWEEKVKLTYNIELHSPLQDRANIFALITEILRKVIADNPVGSEEQEALNLRAATSAFSGCLRAIKEFRNYFAGKFVIQQDQDVPMPEASALPTSESGDVDDGISGNDLSIPRATYPHSVLTLEAATQDSSGPHISREDTFEPEPVQQPKVDSVSSSPSAEREKVESMPVDVYRQSDEKGRPGSQTGQLQLAYEVKDRRESDKRELEPLEQVDQDDGPDDLFEEDPNQEAEIGDDAKSTHEVLEQAEPADLGDMQDIVRFEEQSPSQQDHEPALTSSAKISNEVILGIMESAEERPVARLVSPIASEPAKRTRKRRAQQASRSRPNVAAAAASSAPTTAEIEAHAALQAEMEEASFRRAEELGAARAWIEMQTITGSDGIRYRVEPHDVVNWHGEYRATGQPVTENDAHAAVQWMKAGRPGVHSSFTENTRERKRRENRERAKEQRRLRTERVDE